MEDLVPKFIAAPRSTQEAGRVPRISRFLGNQFMGKVEPKIFFEHGVLPFLIIDIASQQCYIKDMF